MNKLKAKSHIIVLFLILSFFAFPFLLGAFDKDKPAASTSLRSSNPEILANWSQLQTGINNEHIFSGTSAGTQTGDHTQGSARTFSQASAPATRIDTAGFLSTDLGSLWTDTDDNAVYVLTATSPTWTPLSTEVIATLLASNRVFAGTLGVDGDFEVGTGSEFTVAAASGNTQIAGTLDVTGNIDPTTYETTNGGFLDENDLVTDSAAATASQQSIKAYVDAYIKLVDSKATTTDGGTFTSGSWQKRDIAEESDIGGHVSVSSSVIVLDAGTYQCKISCPATVVDAHQARLRNTTAGSTVLVGTSERANVGQGGANRSFISGIFTIAGSQSLEIQHQCQTTRNNDGFGLANDFGENEIYTIAEFWKR